MNFIRNVVLIIPRVNLHTKSIVECSSILLNEQKEINKNKFNKEKTNKKNIKNNEIDKIDKLDNEYLTKKSIEHSLK
jgi:hypothetical protein